MRKKLLLGAVRYLLVTLAVLCFPWCGWNYSSNTVGQHAIKDAEVKKCVVVVFDYRPNTENDVRGIPLPTDQETDRA